MSAAEIGNRDHLWHIFTVVLRGDRERTAKLAAHFDTPDDWLEANWEENEELAKLIKQDHNTFAADDTLIDTNMLSYGWFIARVLLGDSDSQEIDEAIRHMYQETESRG